MQFKLNPLSYLDLHIFFFFNDPPTTEIYTLSLHDALPIFVKYCATWLGSSRIEIAKMIGMTPALLTRSGMNVLPPERSEEHTSELQSRFDLVCRLLLEKKNIKKETRKSSSKYT